MLCLKNFKKIIRDKSGEMMLPIMIFILIAVIIFLYGLDIFNAALDYQNVTYSAKSITKVIECDGAVTDRAYKHMEELNESFNMNMTFDVSDVQYFDSRERSIQFRDPFKVTVKYTAEIQLASPVFSKPIVWKLPMSADVPGMSEVYWK